MDASLPHRSVRLFFPARKKKKKKKTNKKPTREAGRNKVAAEDRFPFKFFPLFLLRKEASRGANFCANGNALRSVRIFLPFFLSAPVLAAAAPKRTREVNIRERNGQPCTLSSHSLFFLLFSFFVFSVAAPPCAPTATFRRVSP